MQRQRRLLHTYWRVAQEAAAINSGLPVPTALDATGVGKHSIQDCAVPWPTNVAAWLFPQIPTGAPLQQPQPHRHVYHTTLLCLVNGSWARKVSITQSIFMFDCLLNGSALFSKLFRLGPALAF